jgi:hypothetical protein
MMNEEDQYDDQRVPVKEAMRSLYYDWMDVRPSKYPPNLYPRVLTVHGKISQQNYLPLKGVTKEHYQKYEASDAKYMEILWEFTPNGKRETKPMFLGTKAFGSKNTYWSFGSCNSCWKLSRRNFANPSRTPHPLKSTLENPNLPRMGRCGCICCNQCIRELELHPANQNESYVHCPYCGSHACFSKNLRIWVVSKEVKTAKEIEEVKEVVVSRLGAGADYKISKCKDGVMIDLGK